MLTGPNPSSPLTPSGDDEPGVGEVGPIPVPEAAEVLSPMSAAEEVAAEDEEEVVREMIVDYESFFAEQFEESSKLEKAMARSIFIKYNLNDYQGKLLKNQNEPNPVFLQELANLLSHFVWNWGDFLSKYKIV